MRHSLKFRWRIGVVLSAIFLALQGHAMAATPDYPLKRGSNPRYLVDQNDRPFLIHGDSPWSLMVQPTDEEVDQYLRDRQRKGFNSIIVNLIENFYCDNPPYNRHGEPPFTIEDDYSTPNPAYFAHVDWVLRKAADYGMQVFLFPSYLGTWGGSDPNYPPQGWYQEMVANGAETLRQYGRFLGQRYKDFDNIVWVHGGDYNPPERGLVSAIAEGILEFDTNHLQTVHTGPEWSAVEFYTTESWIDINNTYSYDQPLILTRTDYARVPATPFFLIEAKYEGDIFNATSQEIRRQAYWSVFSGSCGQFMGNLPLYAFATGWQQAMDDVASHDMANLRRLMDSRPWWTFVPDLENTLVVAGGGDPASLDPSQFYVTTERVADGSSCWAYVPTGRTITIDMSQLSGTTVQAWWYNPRTGNATAIGQFGNVGLQQFTTPTSEGGADDWVWVADDASLNLPPPGMINIQGWRNTCFTAAELQDPAIVGDLSDPDGDGRTNLMEYALNSDPTVSDIMLSPTEVSLAAAESEEFLNFRYTRRKNAMDLSFGVKAGNNLQDWSLLGETTVRDNGFTESIGVQDSAPVSSAAMRYMRLEVTHDP